MSAFGTRADVLVAWVDVRMLTLDFEARKFD
jgi:hypothetical protein